MGKKTYRQILKSTSVIGGSQVITVLVGIVRSKFVAVLLGPAGFGLVGLYQSIVDLVRSVTSFGIGFSAVRDIAESSGDNEDKVKVARTYAVVYRLSLLTGILGALVTAVFSPLFSYYTFGDQKHTLLIGLMSFTLITDSISGGKSALIQGMMQISKLAKVKIALSILTLVISLPLYYLYNISAVVPVIIINSLLSLALFSLFAEKLDYKSYRIKLKEVFTEGYGMIRLGFYTSFVTFLGMIAMYLVKVFVTRKGGIEAVGYFQAAWSFSITYIGAVLTAMATDFFPRLSSVNQDAQKVREMVNEQTQMALFLAGPIIIGMLTFMPFLIHLFYSPKFSQTIQILQWQMMGDFLKILSWPIGMILLAKNISRPFVLVETFWLLLFVLGIYAGWDAFGLNVTGIAFLISYFLYYLVLLVVVAKVASFRYSLKTWGFVLIYGSVAFLSFLNSLLLSGLLKYVTGVVLLVFSLAFSFYYLNKYVDILEFVRKKLKLS